jgi:Uma2 family endonuclease
MSAIPTYPQRHIISTDEYLRMAHAGVFSTDVRLELMEGEIIEMAPIGSGHAAVVNSLAALLNRACGDSMIVSVQNPIVTGERSVPQPDLALLRTREDKYFNAHPKAADVSLVVEVSDTTLRFDLDQKLLLYARAGIPELWVVDLETRVVHVQREPAVSGYVQKWRAIDMDTISILSLPGISIAVASIFPVR